jgi:glycosyltransferase involved in cell wall biosynthesis
MSVSVVVGTFGDSSWKKLARNAVASAKRQTVAADSVLHVHADTLQEARNSGAEQSTGEWICFLDADDELDEFFIEAMEDAISKVSGPALLQPSNLNSDVGYPVLLRKRSLERCNFLIIGTVVRRDQFLEVGGFSDLPVLEDWELWIRLSKAGAEHRAVPDAIYKINVRPGSRNSNHILQNEVANYIRKIHFS